MKNKNSTKGQLTLGDAPSIVLIVGLVFLTMATVALVGDKFGSAMLSDEDVTVTNESVAYVNQTNYTVHRASELGFTNFAVTQLYNVSSKTLIPLANITQYVTTGKFKSADFLYNSTNVTVTYTFTHTPETVAYNTTGDLQTEIDNNTSIAGIVLTISLVGIVLSILIGVFLGVSRRSNRV
jgi:hypothetical protein